MRSGMRQWIQENFRKYNNDREKIMSDCMARFHHTRSRIKDLLAQMRRAGEIPPSSFPISGRGIEFRASVESGSVVQDFEDEDRICEAIKKLGSRVIKDIDFRIELGIPNEQWKAVSQQLKFSNNKQELKGRRFRGLYWGDAAVIKDLRKKIEL